MAAVVEGIPSDAAKKQERPQNQHECRVHRKYALAVAAGAVVSVVSVVGAAVRVAAAGVADAIAVGAVVASRVFHDDDDDDKG